MRTQSTHIPLDLATFAGHQSAMSLPVTDGRVADAVKGHWADRILPVWSRPYARLARLERPIGWWLLLFPCWWSSALASASLHQWPNLLHIALFLIGAVAMRGAGCTWNDLTDHDIDAKVERTASRPIPSGQVSPKQAFAFLGLQALVGLVVLLSFNRLTIVTGLASLLVVAVYPFMKRVTDWPQFVLGLAFNWGALVGWTALTDGFALPPVLLYVGGILFTIGYDTIYACQDKADDAIVGVRSTARLFGDHARPAVAGFYLATLVLFGLAFMVAGSGPLAYLGLAGFAAHLGWQVARFDPENGDRCLMLFRANRTAGLILFAGLVGDAVLRSLMG
jgi:4-hydroxybenzoate polyprenyltransferase